MQRDMGKAITSINGGKFEVGSRSVGFKTVGDKQEPIIEPVFLTLGMVAVTALVGVFEEEGRVLGPEKVRRMALATRINAGGVVEVVAEDVALLKKLIDICYPSPEIVACAWGLLDADYTDESASFGDNIE